MLSSSAWVNALKRRDFIKLVISAGIVFTIGGVAYILGRPYARIKESEPLLEDISSVATVVEGLEIPWSIAPLGDGSFFVSERPGRLVFVSRDGSKRLSYSINVASVGEAGFLGIALHPDYPSKPLIYAYISYYSGPDIFNRVVKLRIDKLAMKVTSSETLLNGIPGGYIHNGGRLRFGPDGMLYITTGDAGVPQLAQDVNSLAGKILRIEGDGEIPRDNPYQRSPVYSYGHRNPQGIDWHPSKGYMIASEHGPRAHDEINLIKPGGNYGWPIVTGRSGNSGYIDPLIESGSFVTWAPSGASFIKGRQFRGLEGDLLVACLRGERILRVEIENENTANLVEEAFHGAYGRLRDVVIDYDGSILIATSNRDGRGAPRRGDDRVLRIYSKE